MSPKSTKEKASGSKLDNIPEDLGALSRSELQSLAKQYGISAKTKSETIRRNLKNYTRKATISNVTRLDTQLSRNLQDLVFEKVYEMANPEFERKIRDFFDRYIYVGDSIIQYNYSKIREKLKLKHNITDRELHTKLENFRHKYVRVGIIPHYVALQHILENFEVAGNASDFKNYNRKLKIVENGLRRSIEQYNKHATRLKRHFDSEVNSDYVDGINDFIKRFNNIAPFKRLPYLNYGTIGHNSNNRVSRKTKSLHHLSRPKSFKMDRARTHGFTK